VKAKRVEKSDLPAITRFLAENSRLTGEPIALDEKLEDSSFLLYKFLDGNKFLAFLEIELFGSAARLNCLAIEGNYRNAGRGTEIIENALGGLREKGIERVSLFVRSSNAAAKALYEKSGFGFVGVLQDPESGESVEEMEIELVDSRPAYVS